MMKTTTPGVLLTALFLAAGLHSPATAADTSWVRYEAKPNGATITMSGTSTLHDWTVETKLVGGTLELPADFPLDPAVTEIPTPSATPKVDVRIPSRSLKSGKKAMDNVMLTSMNSKDHPMIQFKLSELTPVNKERKSGDPLHFIATGDLTVSGVTRKVEMPVTFETPQADAVLVKGTTSVKMTDFGITPPRPKIALGLLTTGDEVQLAFDWLTLKAKEEE